MMGARNSSAGPATNELVTFPATSSVPYARGIESWYAQCIGGGILQRMSPEPK
jgi:hypothetical protein